MNILANKVENGTFGDAVSASASVLFSFLTVIITFSSLLKLEQSNVNFKSSRFAFGFASQMFTNKHMVALSISVAASLYASRFVPCIITFFFGGAPALSPKSIHPRMTE